MPNAKNIIVLIKSNTIERWYSIVRLSLKLILLDLKLRKKSLILTHSSILHSSVLTVKKNTKPITRTVYFKSTDSIESGI